MKKLLPALVFLTVLACNNSAVDSNASKEPETLSTAAKPATKRVLQCCFASQEECRQFLPGSATVIKQVAASDTVVQEFSCSEDFDTPNGVTQLYSAGSGKLTLRISDYCVSPGRAGTDYDRKYKSTLSIYPKDKQVKELTTSAVKGFAVYSPSDKSSYLHAVVDGRFKITIAGTNQDSFDHILSLWQSVPVDRLAAFKKA